MWRGIGWEDGLFASRQDSAPSALPPVGPKARAPAVPHRQLVGSPSPPGPSAPVAPPPHQRARPPPNASSATHVLELAAVFTIPAGGARGRRRRAPREARRRRRRRGRIGWTRSRRGVARLVGKAVHTVRGRRPICQPGPSKGSGRSSASQSSASAAERLTLASGPHLRPPQNRGFSISTEQAARWRW